MTLAEMECNDICNRIKKIYNYNRERFSNEELGLGVSLYNVEYPLTKINGKSRYFVRIIDGSIYDRLVICTKGDFAHFGPSFNFVVIKLDRADNTCGRVVMSGHKWATGIGKFHSTDLNTKIEEHLINMELVKLVGRIMEVNKKDLWKD